MKSPVLVAIAATLLALISGCSGKAPLAKVKGTVTLNGQPLAKGTIIFETPGQRPATGRIENGQIVEVTCYTTGDGVPVGSHKVAIAATDEAASAVVANPGDAKAPGANYMTGKSLIPAHYNDPSASGLTAEIKRGENVLEFKLVSE
jgi:hypothetical protein